MDLFSLVAKLTLDSKDYERDIANLERQSIEVGDVKIGVDTSDFDSAVSDIDNTTIDDLEAAASLDTQDFEQGVKDISEKSDEFSTKVGGMFSSLDKVLAGLGIVALITQIFNFMQKCINLTSDYADAVDKGSGALGMSYKQYQIWDYALGQSGGNVNELNRGMILFHKTMGATDDQIQQMVTDSGEMSEEMEEAAESAGASSEKLKTFLSGRGIDVSKITSAEELMKTTLLEIAEISDETERKNLVTEFFGRNATGVLNLVKDGRAAVEELFEKPVEMGLIMSDQSVKNGVAYGDAVSDLNKELDALKQIFVESILPILTDAIEKITAILAFFNGRTDRSLGNVFKQKDDAFATEISQIEATATVANTMWDKLIAMGDYSKLNAQQQAEWKGTAEWLIENVPSLAGVIDTETGSIHANTEEVRKNIKEWENASKKRALTTLIEEKRQAIVDRTKEATDTQVLANIAEGEVEAKRAGAIEYMNSIFRKYGLDDMLLAENATAREIMDARQYMATNYSHLFADESSMMSELYSNPVIKDFATTVGKYEGLTQKAESLRNEVAQANQDLEVWISTAFDIYGIAEDDADELLTKLGQVTDKIAQLPELIQIKVVSDIDPSLDNFRNPGSVRMFKQAKGDWIVPYDDYPSLLHRGEMVLTASQARQLRGGGGGEIDYTHLGQVVADAIRSGMDGVTVDSYLDGRLITEAVSREMAAQMSARRFG